MRWIARLDEVPSGQAPATLDGPLCWIASHAAAADWRLPSPLAADLADAARARREGGAPRLLRRRMLRALLARLFGVRPDALAFTRSAAGAPGIEGLPVHLSTSGCEGWSAVALGPRPLGIDIETDPAPDLELWVLHEAYAKATGAGLSLPLDGRGAGVGVLAPAVVAEAHEAPPLSFLNRPAHTPIPALPPSRGKGGAWTRQVAPGVLAAVVQLAST